MVGRQKFRPSAELPSIRVAFAAAGLPVASSPASFSFLALSKHSDEDFLY